MKISVAYVKKNPVMFGVIFVVFGLILYVLLNRSHSSGSTQVVTTGPSDAQLAAATQLSLAQISAAAGTQQGQFQLAALEYSNDSQTAQAGLAANVELAKLASDERVANLTTSASVDALHAQLDNSLATTVSNNTFMVDYAKVAADSATTQLMIGAALQRDLSAQQLDAYKTGIEASVVNMAYNRAMTGKNNTASLNAATTIASGFLAKFNFSGNVAGLTA